MKEVVLQHVVDAAHLSKRGLALEPFLLRMPEIAWMNKRAKSLGLNNRESISVSIIYMWFSIT